MLAAEELRDELYSIDDSHWTESISNILHLLNFPVELKYACGWEEYVYVRSERNRYLQKEDKRLIAQCKEIALFGLDGKFRRFNLVTVRLTGNHRLRNEKANDIYRLFRKIFGRYLFFVVNFDDAISFLGTGYGQTGGREVIISDWFDEKSSPEMLERLEEIDFALFSDENAARLYSDYLWAIARPYVKYRESKMFLIFGCENVVMHEAFVPNQEGDGFILADVLDREETLRINSEYYPFIYGDDYFVDDTEAENDSLDIIDEDDAEFEWTMLEMELDKEALDLEEEIDEEEDEEDEYYNDYDEDEEDISGMNPEEMLKHIRGE